MLVNGKESAIKRQLNFSASRYAQAEKRQRHSEMTMKWNIKLDM